MRRRALALAGILAALCAGLPAQSTTPEPALAVTLDTAGPTPEARVRAERLFAGGRFLPLLHSGFPLYLEYRVELWRSRSGWFDQFASEVRWQVAITHDPLTMTYLLERSDGWREEIRDTNALERALRTLYRVPFEPGREGRFYVVATLDAHTLTDSDLEEAARWLRGDLAEVARERGGVGEALARGARRLLVRAAGLPRVRIQARSPEFTASRSQLRER